MGQQLTVHQDDVQASAHIVFHRTHDPKGKEEKQNTTIGPECGGSTVCSRLGSLRGPPQCTAEVSENTQNHAGHLLSSGDEQCAGFSESLSLHVWTRAVCSGNREGSCLGLGGVGERPASLPRPGGGQSPPWLGSPRGAQLCSCHPGSCPLYPGKTVLLCLWPGGSQHGPLSQHTSE